MRRFWSIGLIFILSTTALGFGSKRGKFAEHYENPKWDPALPPVITEAPIKNQKAVLAWEKALKEPSPYCDSTQSWIASNGSRLEAMGVKEHNIEVRGTFLRFRSCLLPETEHSNARGQGWVELASWDSGVEARDRRVTRYVFGVEEEGQSVVPFDFVVEPWKSEAKAGDSWKATMKTKAVFRGLPIATEFPVQITREEGAYKMASLENKELHFMSEPVEQGFRQMLALCNHHFLASYALVGLDINWLPKSKIGTRRPPNKSKKK